MSNPQLPILLQSLDISNFNGSHEEACLYYFQLLRQLNLKIIITKVQIQTGNLILTNQTDKHDQDKPILKNQKIPQREIDKHKSKPIQKNNGIKEHKPVPPPKPKSPNTKQYPQNPIVDEAIPELASTPSPTLVPLASPFSTALTCPVKGCLKTYQTASSLHHHKTLKHKVPAQDWNTNRIYNIEIKENGQTRRNYRH